MRADKIKLTKKWALDVAAVYRTNQTKLHELNYLFWECTLRCNLNCLHCGSDCLSVAQVKDMPADDFIRAIDTIVPHVNTEKTMIVISGGEPLMRKDLEYVGFELYKRRLPWGVVTNGFTLTSDRLHSLLDAGMRSLSLSWDGFEQAHNRLRGDSRAYERALVALDALVTTRELVWDVVTCVSRLNMSELPAMKEFLIAKGVTRWRIFTIFPNGRAKQNPLLQLSAVEFKEVFDFIAQSRKEGLISVAYGCEGFLGGYEYEVRDGAFFCRAGVNIGSILVDGTISGCTSIRSNFSQGNIYNEEFMTVWNTRFQEFRDRTWTRKGDCASCKHYRYCLGNGLHLYDDDKNLSFCHYNRLICAEK